MNRSLARIRPGRFQPGPLLVVVSPGAVCGLGPVPCGGPGSRPLDSESPAGRREESGTMIMIPADPGRRLADDSSPAGNLKQCDQTLAVLAQDIPTPVPLATTRSRWPLSRWRGVFVTRHRPAAPSRESPPPIFSCAALLQSHPVHFKIGCLTTLSRSL